MEQPDVIRHHQTIPYLVPPGAIQCEHGKCSWADLRADFLQMQIHRMDICTRQHEPGANAAIWTDGPEQIGRLVALIARRCGPAAAFCPDAGQAALLADAGLVLPP
jgi:hypothetical protein